MVTQERVNLALKITGLFEGADLFKNVTGDFDDQGVSAGILQWCFGQNSLQNKILGEYMKHYSDLDSQFPEPIEHLVERGSVAEDLDWVRDHMLQPNGKLKPDWLAAFRAFLSKPEVVEIQQRAALGVGASADAIMRRMGLDSNLAFCWCFDIVTQNGGMKGVGLALPDRDEAERIVNSMGGYNRSAWLALIPKATDEAISLLITSHRRALLSIPRWQADVFARKATIALGQGRVHGRDVLLYRSTASGAKEGPLS